MLSFILVVQWRTREFFWASPACDGWGGVKMQLSYFKYWRAKCKSSSAVPFPPCICEYRDPSCFPLICTKLPGENYMVDENGNEQKEWWNIPFSSNTDLSLPSLRKLWIFLSSVSSKNHWATDQWGLLTSRSRGMVFKIFIALLKVTRNVGWSAPKVFNSVHGTYYLQYLLFLCPTNMTSMTPFVKT